MKAINLFCFPFAGGNKYSYRQFEQTCPPFIRLIPLEYPGRGTRLKEPFLSDMYQLADDLYNIIKEKINEADYALYGHSMGGVVGFLVLKKIYANNHRKPLHFFVTGTSGPSVPRGAKKRHLMEKKDFIEEMRKLDGCPEEILADEDMLDYFEPILRADFRISETFRYETEETLPIPITVITGTQEEMEKEKVQLWQQETSLPVDFRSMPGKHFFIFKYPYELIELISKKLLHHNKQLSYE